ncbi:hypothetical protein [Mangrovicoccus sp. HB161399]|uniref:hypothetical protein n=1 Tax=Mangrovicoccus sp. HB161399 TaxID=2720392 RepID=UPI001552E850|nr:hypothetical protein [Mangrovicoccus sp. HB161399]
MIQAGATAGKILYGTGARMGFLAPLVAAKNDPAHCEAIVRDAVYECLQELSETTVQDMAG